jgi:hypothetical protein
VAQATGHESHARAGSGDDAVNRTATEYETEATEYETEATTCLATAEHNNVGTQQAAYWLARAQVYATLAVAAAALARAGEG